MDSKEDKTMDDKRKTKFKKRKRSNKSDGPSIKKPMFAYNIYLKEKRDELSNNNTNLSFNDVTEILATQWADMTPKEKRPYNLRADKEKREYAEKVKEMEDGESENEGELNQNEKLRNSEAEFNIPIFTEEFLDYNKTKESELRNLRKTCSEFKEQNVILSRHVDELKNAVNKLDSETKTQQESNVKSAATLKKLRENLVRSFINVQLPETGMRPTLENIDKYMKNVYVFLEKDPNKYSIFSQEVRAVMRMLDITEV